MIEKRMMMKFLQFSLNYTNQPEEYEGEYTVCKRNIVKKKHKTEQTTVILTKYKKKSVLSSEILIIDLIFFQKRMI